MPNELAGRSIQVSARDESGRWLPPGPEVQLVEEGGGTILGTRQVDSGGSYNAQGAPNMHFGIPAGVDRVVRGPASWDAPLTDLQPRLLRLHPTDARQCRN